MSRVRALAADERRSVRASRRNGWRGSALVRRVLAAGARAHTGYGGAAAFFAAVVAVYFAHALFGGGVLLPFDFLVYLDPVFAAGAPGALPARPSNVLMGWDRVYQFHPWLVFNFQAFARGEFPLWNPLSAGGTPHLALDQTAVLDPVAFVAGLLFGPHRAGTLRAVLSVGIAGAGMLALTRRLRLPAAGGLIAALAFSFGGWFILWLGRPMSVAAAWLPWILWGIDRLLEGRRPMLDAALVAGFVAFSLFAGHIETTAHVLVFAVIFTAFAARRHGSRPGTRLRAVLPGLAALAAGVAAAAILVLPFAAFLLGEAGGPGIRGGPDRSAIATLLAGLRGAVDPAQVLGTLTTAVVPVLALPGSLRFAAPPPNLGESTIYIGAVPLLLAVLAPVMSARRGEVWFWVAAAAAGLALCWRLPVWDLVNQLPGMRWTEPGRLRLVYVFAASVLSAYGVDALSRARLRIDWRVVLAAAALLGLGAIWTASRVDAADPDALRRGLAGWCAALLLLPALRMQPSPRLRLAIVGLTAVELTVALHGVQPTLPAEDVYPTTPVTTYLRQAAGSRIATYPIDGRKPMAGASHLVYGLDSVEGYNVLYSSRWRKLMDLINEGAPPRNDPGEDWVLLEDPGDPLVDLLGVDYLITADVGRDRLAGAGILRQFSNLAWEDGRVAILENPDPLPAAFFVERVHLVATPDAAAAALRRPELDFRREAVVEASTAESRIRPHLGAPLDAHGTIDARPSRFDEVILDLNRRTPGFLVIRSAFSRGWHATLDGQPRELLPTDVAFMGMEIPAGHHRLRLHYDPLAFRIGSAVTMITFLALAVGVLIEQQRKRRAWR
ncbi:MAG TPA: YfhO family protein [Longimicrobiales bacterium]